MTAAIIWKTVTGFLGKIPWQAYAAIALIAAFWWWGNNQYSAGVDATDAKWGQAAEKLQEEADAAALAATAEREIRDQAFGDSQADIKEGIDNAKTDDPVGGGVQSYFDRLRNQKNSDSTEAAD